MCRNHVFCIKPVFLQSFFTYCCLFCMLLFFYLSDYHLFYPLPLICRFVFYHWWLTSSAFNLVEIGSSVPVFLFVYFPQLWRPQDREAAGRELVDVLAQDGVLLGLPLNLHDDPHCSHDVSEALRGLGRPSLTLSGWVPLLDVDHQEPLPSSYLKTQPYSTLNFQSGG